MAIKTSTFGGWKLSGDDAEAFIKQINEPSTNNLAQTSYQRGKKLLNEYRLKGFAVVRPKEKK